jgi:soluble lytic murein transglycosylase-like protein
MTRRRVRAAWTIVLICVALAGGSTVRADEEARAVPSSRSGRAAAVAAVEQWRPALDAYAWPVDTALRVIACESLGDPDAVNPSSGASGLFQVMPYLHQWRVWRLFGEWRSLRDPWVNIAIAFELWEIGGWAPWTASAGCWR